MNEDYTTTLIPVDIRGIMAGVIPDIALQNEDKLHISSLFDLREPYTVRIRGAVNEPGEFDYSHNMTIEDVILLAGGLKEAASVINVEVARRMKNPMSSYPNNKIAQTYSFTLSEDLIIDPDAGTVFTLQPFDEIFIRYSPEYSRQQVVQIRGEVTFVGDYVLSEKNFRLSDLINKAGGLTPDAYIKGASLKRKVTEDELRRLGTLLAMSANQSGNDSISLSTIDLEQYAVGIDLQKALSYPGSNADLVLQDGDELYIPQMQNTVKITGAVNYPNSVIYSEIAGVKDYLSQSGGYQDNAHKYPIVIYMNGMVATTKKKGIFFKKYPKVEPGSEIIIPERSLSLSGTRMSPTEVMSLASSTTSIAAMVTSIINTLSK
ncbi:MAG: SLBB domain-containing protein [Tannerellaceae bacterium]|nr:SLBB domain-containing protein [Tannerellaceae bacterium]